MGSQEQIDNANLLLTQHRLKLEWNQMVWSVNNLRYGTAGSNALVVIDRSTPDCRQSCPLLRRVGKLRIDRRENCLATLVF